MLEFLKWLGKVLTPPESPYILRVGDVGDFVKVLAKFQYGMYWIKQEGRLYPLRKERMSRTAYELVESNQFLQQGDIRSKSWCPLSKQMLAWYDMLPGEQENKTTEEGLQL